jgi:hypothetical protein
VANGTLLRPFGQAVRASNEVKCRDLRLQPRLQEDLRFALAGTAENLWWQVAEYCYETFMIRIRRKGEGEPSEIQIFCRVIGRADTLCQTSISRFVSIPGRLSKRRRPRRLDHCRSAPLRYGGSRSPPPRLRISSSVVGISFGDGIGGLVTRRASCGAAVLVPVRRNTAPLLLPPASMPSRA